MCVCFVDIDFLQDVYFSSDFFLIDTNVIFRHIKD